MHLHHHDFTTPSDPGPVPRAGPGDVVTIDVREGDPVQLPPPGDFHPGKTVKIEVKIPLMAENNRMAEQNRLHFKEHNLKVFNLVSGPGAGKTTLLKRTLETIGESISCGVMVGDLETDNDAQRLRHQSVPVAQLNTGSACHLDASMIARGFESMHDTVKDLIFIENVGNLVCPAEFDLGETVRVALFACTDGEDKPLKYPPVYRSAHVVLLTKCDIAEACGFDRETAYANLRKIAPQAKTMEVSSKTGDGFDRWIEFIKSIL